MLLPALIPICAVGTPAGVDTVSDALAPALLAMAAHTAAMLVVSGIMAFVVCRGVNAGAGLLRGRRHTSPPAAR